MFVFLFFVFLPFTILGLYIAIQIVKIAYLQIRVQNSMNSMQQSAEELKKSFMEFAEYHNSKRGR